MTANFATAARTAASWCCGLFLLACGSSAPPSHDPPGIVDAGTDGATLPHDDGGGMSGSGGTGGSDSGLDGAGAGMDAAIDFGEPPPSPTLMSPANGAEHVPADTELCWEPVEDPEGAEVRYAVFVDGIELESGKLGENGFAGPCTGRLAFNYEQTYAWYVLAFERSSGGSEDGGSADHSHPYHASAPSETWTFTTTWNGDTKKLFEDNFDADNGWTVDGDASQGAWIRGTPEETHDGSGASAPLAQPGDCAGGDSCFLTGHNPSDGVRDEDVAGGSTVLLSPPFDMRDVIGATVSLSRFFYKSAEEETGTLLRVELLVPDTSAPTGERAFVLEQLQDGGDGGTNLWTPITYSACAVPYVDGARLRITATDLGDGVLEAAIDSVTVTGYRTSDPCAEGAGALCDPNAATPCQDGLLCCAEGVLNTGVFRCAEPVAAISTTHPGGSPDAPNTGPLGCDAPDLTVSDEALGITIESMDFPVGSCAVREGCVDAYGMRKLLRFNTQTPNIGSKDLVMGVPSNHPDLYVYSACHDHYHFDGYANYALLDESGESVARGHKQAFCLIDWTSWAWPSLEEGAYTCYNQGIARGWEDIYESDLDCQWIDITDVPAGSYTLEISINQPPDASSTPRLVERDYSNNILRVPVTVP